MLRQQAPGWRQFFRRLSRLDKAALGVAVVYLLVVVAGLLGFQVPGSGFLGFLFFFSAAYLLFRGMGWLKREGLWSLRNRLAVAYLFIAVVPVILLLAMAALSGFIVYSQLGSYLVQNDLQKRIDRLSAIAEAVAGYAVLQGQRGAAVQEEALRTTPQVSAILESASAMLPGIRIEMGVGEGLLQRYGDAGRQHFAGLVQKKDQPSREDASKRQDEIWLYAVVARGEGRSRVLVSASVEVNEDFLQSLAPQLGVVQMSVWKAAGPQETGGLVFEAEKEGRFIFTRQIISRNRTLPAAINWMDFEVTGTCKLEAVPLAASGEDDKRHPVFAPFSARSSQLSQQLFSSLGELGTRPIQLLVLVAVVFLLLELAALRAGVRLTSSITSAVDELSRATQQVQNGDLGSVVRIQQRDQLGSLGESFNEMITSISNLIEEQNQRQKLENELSIAREVQAQLFPQEIPKAEGIELAAAVRAARVVSGDYFDFVSLGPNRLGMVIADISGKGISAALLMASLQAALRSQVLLDGHVWHDTKELAARLNRHLFVNTSPDRYATFFYAAYDAGTRMLHYTNGGHLPPLYLVGETVRELEEGGMVVGLFDDAEYEQGTIHVEPGALLVAYSDGLVECENVYGEEFGRKGIRQELLRHRHEPPQRLAEALVQAAEDWTGAQSRADDMTVIVARLG